MYAGGAALPLQRLWLGTYQGFMPWFFLGEVCPALSAEPPVRAGVNATLGQSVAFTLVAEFKDCHSFTNRPFGMSVPLRSLISS